MADMTAFEQLDSLIREQKNRIHTLNETLKEVDIAVNRVGETIEPGTQYTYDGTTYTTYTGAEIFNAYTAGSGRNGAAGSYSHAEGQYNNAYGSYSHAEGQSNITTESCAHAEGSYNKSTGYSSHTEGQNNQASGYAAHAEGGFTKALENYAHTEGQSTQVKSGAYNGHAEGYSTVVEKPCGHTEGRNTKVITNGECAHAEGDGTTASGNAAHSEGYMTTASGIYAHAEGGSCTASEAQSHAEGSGTTASGTQAHAEGRNTTASGYQSHAEGDATIAAATGSHAEGTTNEIKSGANYSHVEGGNNIVNAQATYSHTEGRNHTNSALYGHAEGLHNTLATNADCGHAEGRDNTLSNYYTHAEGQSNTASGITSHAEGSGNTTNGDYSHVEGHGNTINSGASESHAEGNANTINSTAFDAHVEGFSNTVSGFGSHAEGGNNTIGTNANSAHAEGYSNTVTAAYAHVEGYSCDVYGGNAHAEGCDTLATGIQSHAEGNMTQAHGAQSHVEGSRTVCTNTANSGHAEGHASVASGDVSHAQNESTQASGSASTAMGDNSVASGSASTAMGYYTIANGTNQLALGKYNISDANNTYAMIIGNGDSSDRSDAFKVDWNGKIYVGNNNGVDVSGLYVTSNDDAKVLTATYQNGVGTYSWAPASGGAPECIIVTDTSTSLPNKVVIENNHEYRYLNLANATSITISIENVDITKSFYSTVVLHDVTSTDILSNFVSVSQDSVLSNVIFLNEDFVDLSDSNTVEMLFFTNGMANTVMCIAYGYTSASPEPPAPVYPDDKILVIELDSNHEDTDVITEHTTLASAKSDLDSKYSTDNTKLYKLYVGDNVTTDSVNIPYISNSLFEDTHNLYSAILGECIHNLNGAVFYGCENLTEISLPETNLESTVGYNFTGTNLPSLTIPSGCHYLRISGQVDAIFFNNNLTNLVFDTSGTIYLATDENGADDGTEYDVGVFSMSSYLDTSSSWNKPTTITFTENVTSIVADSGGYLFGAGSSTGNVTINISNAVTSISSSFLKGVDSLAAGITVTVNIDNASGAITDPNNDNWGAGSTLPANCTINYLR